jgi:hypothetical protein
MINKLVGNVVFLGISDKIQEYGWANFASKS